MIKTDLTVCVLLYGNYLPYARRCLESVLSQASLAGCDLRIGLNNVGRATTRHLYADFVPRFLQRCGVRERDSVARPSGRLTLVKACWHRDQPACKYPVMRALFALPGRRAALLWMDDDSYFRVWDRELLPQLTECVREGGRVLGLLQHCPLTVAQERWTNGRWGPRNRDSKDAAQVARSLSFVQGGWWLAATKDVVPDWPPPELRHCGGDILFGEFCRQRQLRLLPEKDWPPVVRGCFATNAAIGSEQHNTARRRGYSELPFCLSDDYPVGAVTPRYGYEYTFL